MEKECLSYPFIQKYYSSLTNINNIDCKDNIFEIIPKLDSFLNEFKTITYVMKKSFSKNNELKKLYDEKYKELLDNDKMKWFVDKRNNIVHEHPFKLEKTIIVDIYEKPNNFKKLKTKLTINHDLDFAELTNSIKELLDVNYKEYLELWFSTSIVFTENKQDFDIYSTILNGIEIMGDFIALIKNKVVCSCNNCVKIDDKVKDLIKNIQLKQLMFIQDCVFINGKIETGFVAIGQGVKNNNFILEYKNFRIPIKGHNIYGSVNTNECPVKTDFNILSIFAGYNLILAKQQLKELKKEPNLLSSFMLIFDDNTFTMTELFTGSLKSTNYRMINNIVDFIKENNVRSVLYLTEMSKYNETNSSILLSKNYKERLSFPSTTIQGNFLINKDLNSIISINFDYNRIYDNNYNRIQLTTPNDEYQLIFLQPIYNALKEKT